MFVVKHTVFVVKHTIFVVVSILFLLFLGIMKTVRSGESDFEVAKGVVVVPFFE